jgi:cytochrome c biogenesis protein CcmG, thiol:disulfide interchange protein DsbE
MSGFWRYARYAIPIAVFAVIGAFFYRGLSLNPTELPSPLVGKPAPAFSLPGLVDSSRTISAADLEGQISLLNVWGTWCVECRHEHAFLVELSQSGVPIYGLNLKDDRAAALRWLATLGNPYVESAFDADGGVAIDWGVYGAPETFLIGRDGTVLHKHISVLTPDVWQREFLPRIREECGALPCPLVDGESAR